MELNCAFTPGLSNPVSFSIFDSRISGVTCPPPAISAQWPAFAAAATISGSTVVGVMPASIIGERPVRRVNLVSTLVPVLLVTSFGANSVHFFGRVGPMPGSNNSA